MGSPGTSLSLSGQVALVSGGSRGIGAATVKALVAAGARVALSYERAQASAEQVAAECGPERCAAIQADLSDAASAGRLVEAAVRRFGRLDILVGNHGIWPPRDIAVDQMSDGHWRRTMGVNLDSVFGLVKHAVAQMKRQADGGQVVLVSSTAGQRGEALHCDYAASKGALISFVKGLSTELAPHRIRVNCVAPGWVATDMSTPTLANPEARARVLATIPLGRVGTPEEIALPIVFLCTEHAGFITGEILNVNGGAVLAG